MTAQEPQQHAGGRTNSLAIAALVCGLAGILVWIPAPVGVVLGVIALVQLRRRGGSGKGMAIAGIVLSALVILGVLFLIAVYVGWISISY